MAKILTPAEAGKLMFALLMRGKELRGAPALDGDIEGFASKEKEAGEDEFIILDEDRAVLVKVSD